MDAEQRNIGQLTPEHSPPYIGTMEKLFASLEQKIDRVIAQCDLLRAENQNLRQELILKADEVRLLTDKMEEAKHRLQQLVAQVPE
jgi:cell division protein ZapB